MKNRLIQVLAALLTIAGGLNAAERRPNFLFIYTDDQRWDAVGVVQREQGERARFPWFTTPNMDRLATEGVRFRNAFVTLSLCAPSRSAFLTGRYNHANGVIDNHTPFPTNNVTHATLLRAAGYKTAYIGKFHHGAQRGPRPGFDFSASFIGQGRYENCPFEINGELTDTKGWVDDVSTDHAIQFMKEHRAGPFSIVLGFKACHGPNTPPERAKQRFEGEKSRSVPNLEVKAIYRAAADQPATKAEAAGTFASERNVNLNYLRCISAADDNLGRLLKALDDLALDEDTVVIFTSDNGYYNGEHRLGDKRSAYDESLRVPFLVRGPKGFPKGKVCDEMILNIDLAPTLLDFAGVKIPAAMQGKSWAPLLAGRKVPWRQSFLAEYFYERGFTGTPTLVAVRTADAKLIKYPGHEEWTELFNLANDPYEIRNLARDPAQRKLLKRMTGEFERQVKLTGYHVPAHADPPGSMNEQKAAKKKKRQP